MTEGGTLEFQIQVMPIFVCPLDGRCPGTFFQAIRRADGIPDDVGEEVP